MSKKHKRFNIDDGYVNVCCEEHGNMFITSNANSISVITKQQAMDFFGLVELKPVGMNVKSSDIEDDFIDMVGYEK